MYFGPGRPGIGLPVALLAATALASPVSQAVKAIEVKRYHQSDPGTICAITYENPRQAWIDSGASAFLDSWLAANGTENWANKIDQQTTENGSQGTSPLDCVDLQGGNCGYPSTLCRFFTPPELYHVRYAMSTCYRMFSAFHEKLQDNTILTSLNIENIISDMGLSATDNGGDLFTALSGAFSIASGLAAAVPIIGGPLTILSSIFSIAGATRQQKPTDYTQPLKDQLAAVFAATEKQTEDTVRTIFGGINTSTLPGVKPGPGPNGETQDIAKFFADGKFLVPVTSQGAITSLMEPFFQKGAEMMRQSLVTTLLKAAGYYIFVDLDRDENDCGSITGSRWIDSHCYTIEHSTPAPGDGQIADTTQAIDAKIIHNFEDPNKGYNLDLLIFYRNSDACQIAHPNYDGKVDSTAIPTDGSLPECFFNLPVIKGNGSPCKAVVQSSVKYPDSLGFTPQACKLRRAPPTPGSPHSPDLD